MTNNTNTNKNDDKINISINIANPNPQEIKKKKKYKKRKPRLSPEDRAKILGGSGGGNYATQIPANYLPKYSDRSIGSGNFFAPQPDNNQRLPLALPYQLPQALNGGIQYIPQQPQQQIQQPQYDFQPQQQIQQQPQQQPQMINIDGGDDRVLYDPINKEMMRPDGDRIQRIEDVEYLPDFENYDSSRPSSRPSSNNIPKPTRPPPPIPQEFEQPLQPIPDDNFQDVLQASAPKPLLLPQSDIVFAKGRRPPPQIQSKIRRLPAYIERTGDNIQIEGSDYYVSRREGLNLTSKLYSRVGRGRNANKLNFMGMTYGDYLNTLRTEQVPIERPALERPPLPIPPPSPPQPPPPPPQPIPSQEMRPPISQQSREQLLREQELDREVSRLLNFRPSPSSSLDLPRPQSLDLPRPPSVPKPFPPRPPSPALIQDSPKSLSADLGYSTIDTPNKLKYFTNKNPDMKPEEFDKLTTNLRNMKIAFDVPRNLRGRVKLMPDEIDVNSSLPPEQRPDSSEKKTQSLMQRMTDTISKYRQLSGFSPKTDLSPLANEGEYAQSPLPVEQSFIEQQASQMRAKTNDLFDDTTQNIVISSIELPPIQSGEIEEIETSVLPEEDENAKMLRQAERMRLMTSRLFDETTQRVLSPPTEIQENPQDRIEQEFQQKYFESQRRRPSSAKGDLEEALYKNKMDEIRPDLEQFDREYGFNYQNYLSGQNIKKEDIETMTDILIKKYGISHKANDLYVKEFLDTFSEDEKKEILKDYEESIVSNVSFYVDKLSRGIANRNLPSRLSGKGSDEQKKELFLRTLTETNTLTSNFRMSSNEDFKEFLFQKYCKENKIKLDNPKTILEIITPVKYPYGARRKIVYRKPTPPISPASSISPPTPVSNQETQKLRFDEPTLPSVVEEKSPSPKKVKEEKVPTPVRPRTKREKEEMDAIASRQPILPPPPPPPRTKSSAPRRPIPIKK